MTYRVITAPDPDHTEIIYQSAIARAPRCDRYIFSPCRDGVTSMRPRNGFSVPWVLIVSLAALLAAWIMCR